MAAPIESSSSLLIGQWSGATRMQGMVDVFREALQDDVLGAIDQIQLERQIETASGVHLDALGERLGVARPSTTDRARDERWGFDSAGEPFDTAPFAGDSANESVFPLPDAIYRRFIRARSYVLISDGTEAYLSLSVLAVDKGATVQDQRDMSVRIVTTERELLQAADAAHCLARNAGVRLTYADRGRFGFDAAGVAFDQGPYATE